ncbi:hypothetical protein [Aliivibrio fischeri]|uniref:hypothetical protein n=1 Tax=Aliivibrio fischeri TaxID=668 RepID=UPI0012DAEF43|nr:hypothetical protein [Aliivibrio fischeri]MUK66333.1 hypothetical protein [Aliivibrio fischeri]
MRVPFGLKNNKIYHIQDVPNGLNCGCVCPNCHHPLIAKNQGQYKCAHFSHHLGTECSDYQVMSYLHRYAQQLIESTKYIVLPEFFFTPEVILLDNSKLKGKTIFKPTRKVNLDLVQNEYVWQRYRIDSFAILKSRELFIEITVTHENDEEKVEAIQAADKPAIEIILSDLHNNIQLFSDEEIKKAVFNPNNVKWIHHPRAMNEVNAELNKLKEEQIKKNKLIKAQLDADERKKLIETKQKELWLENRDKAKLRYREELKEELDWLSNVNASWIKAYELQKRELKPYFLNWVNLDECRELIGFPVKGDWIFESCCEHWQALLITRLFQFDVNEGINANTLKKFIEKHAQLNPNMRRLNIAQYKAKEKAVKNGSTKNWKGAWYLDWEENKKIESPYSPIIKYLEFLEMRDLLGRANDKNVFFLKDNSLKQYFLRMKMKQQAYEELKEQERKREQDRVDLIIRRNQITKDQQKQRAEEMIKADEFVFYHHEGKGIRCQNCFFITPEFENHKNAECPTCGKCGGFVGEIITQNFIDKAVYIYRCGNSPRKSLLNFPKKSC